MVSTQAGWPSGTATAEAAHCGHHIGCSDVRHVCACRWAQRQQSSTGRLDSRVLGPQLVHYAGRVPDEWWGQPRPHKLGRVHLQQPAGGSEAAGRSAHPRWCRHAACGGGPGLPATAQASPPPASGLLLRECASFCKVAYSATVTPPALHTPTLSAFDAEVRACLEALCTGPLPGQAWAQASLATSAGGLGLRLALCGFCLLFGLFAFSVVASCLCFVSCFSAL